MADARTAASATTTAIHGLRTSAPAPLLSVRRNAASTANDGTWCVCAMHAATRWDAMVSSLEERCLRSSRKAKLRVSSLKRPYGKCRFPIQSEMPLPFPAMPARLPVARLDAGLAVDCRGYHSWISLKPWRREWRWKSSESSSIIRDRRSSEENVLTRRPLQNDVIALSCSFRSDFLNDACRT